MTRLFVCMAAAGVLLATPLVAQTPPKRRGETDSANGGRQA